MRLEVDGVQYTNFKSASCEIRLDALSNAFTFEAVAHEGNPLPFKGGEPCKVIVDGDRVITGHIEVVDRSYSVSSDSIIVQGRDKTADLLDSSIGVVSDINGDGLTLKTLIEKVIENIGSDLLVVDEVSPAPFTAEEDIAAPEVGENAFRFIERYSSKRQVLLTSDYDGNLVIGSNSGLTAEGAVQHIIGADDNNVIRGHFTRDTTGRFNKYILSSQLNPVALLVAGRDSIDALISQRGEAIDSSVRGGRQIVIIAESPTTSEHCEERAKWEADIRKARGLVYSAVVQGFRPGPGLPLWETNRVYQIVDDYVGKVETMLCNSVRFDYSVDGGRTTTLGFVGEKTYTLDLDDPTTGKVAENV